MQAITKRVAECIKREGLAQQEHKIYVAVSGGADSVALLTALHLLGYRLTILHCNFHLRGEESDRDEAFVHRLAEKMGIELRIQHFDTYGYKERHKVSLEMAARELRYAWFREIHENEPNSRIVIAHNADDVVETFLYNLSQGTGIKGLRGIPYQRDGYLIRPLLDCTREEIIASFASNPYTSTWCEDSSNQDTRYRRNHIRHKLLPEFEALKPSAREQIGLSIKHLQGVELFYRESIERYKEQVLSSSGIHMAPLLASPNPQTLLYEILSPLGFSSKQCHSIASELGNMRLGSYYQSPSHRLVCSQDILEILPLQKPSYRPIKIELESLPKIVEIGIYRLQLSLSEVALLRDKYILCLPLSNLKGKQLTLRPPEEGERMQPFGMQGRKRISRILIDGHISHREREEAIVLTLDKEILWLIPHCKSDKTRLTDHQSKAPFLRLEILEPHLH